MMGSSSSWSTPAFGSCWSIPTDQPTGMFGPPIHHQAPFSSTIFGPTTSQHSSSVPPAFTMSATPGFGVSSMPSPFGSFDRVSEKGSRVSPYSKTADGDTPFCVQSISAMPVYNSKSHEELRHEDYQRGDKGSFSLQKGIVPSANHSWQPQPPVKPLTHLSEAHVNPSGGLQSSTQGFSSTTNPFWLRSTGPKPSSLFSFPPEPSAGLQSSTQGLSCITNPFWLSCTGPQSSSLFSFPPEPSAGLKSSTQGLSCISNPFWLRSAGPQPSSLFSFPPEPIHKSLFPGSSFSTSTNTAPANTLSTQGHMFHQNFVPAKYTQSGGSLLSSSVTHSAPAPSPNGQCTTINVDHPKKTVELILPADITTVRIRFYSKNDDTGTLASQVRHNDQASATPVSFSIYPGGNQDLTIRSVEQPGPAGEQKGDISDVPLTERSPFGAPGCKVVSESVLPRLHKADYYTLPSITELAARECQEPGFCSRVKDFTVGRHGYGSVKFDGETDVKMLDITSIVEFKDREINAYMDESKRPPVGQELNKPAEITLLNVKCIDQQTGLQLMEGPAVDAYKEILAQWTKNHDAEFISFDAVKGEWKFRVKQL